MESRGRPTERLYSLGSILRLVAIVIAVIVALGVIGMLLMNGIPSAMAA